MSPAVRVVLLSLAGVAFCVPHCSAGFLINGDAETGTTAGWISTGVDVAPVSLAGTTGLPPGVSVGQFSFYAGTGLASSQSLSQVVDVSSLAASIDAGTRMTEFRALLQGNRFTFTVDSVTSTLAYLAADGTWLASASFQDDSIPHQVNDWCAVHDLRVIPEGTRQLLVRFEMSRTGGESTDAFVDNVSLRILPTESAVPEPGVVGLVIAGGVLPLVRGRVRGRV